MKRYIAVLAGLSLSLSARAQPPAKPVPPGTPVVIQVVPTSAPAPPVSITLGSRHGHVIPQRQGLCHSGGGIIDVAQPAPDTLVVTMSGVAVAVGWLCGPGVAAMDFDLNQVFDVVFEKPDVKAARLTLEGRVIGLLRSNPRGNGSSEESQGCCTVLNDKMQPIALCVPDHAVACGTNLSINDHAGPVSVTVGAGPHTLHQVFHILASHPRSLFPCKAVSAEFAPDPALDPLWISAWEPFHGANKKDFGFQVTLKVAPEDVPATQPKKPDEAK